MLLNYAGREGADGVSCICCGPRPFRPPASYNFYWSPICGSLQSFQNHISRSFLSHRSFRGLFCSRATCKRNFKLATSNEGRSSHWRFSMALIWETNHCCHIMSMTIDKMLNGCEEIILSTLSEALCLINICGICLIRALEATNTIDPFALFCLSIWDVSVNFLNKKNLPLFDKIKLQLFFSLFTT